jgi:hypothetical protein
MAESHVDGLDVDGGEHGHVQDVSLESLAALVSLRGGYALVPTLAHERLASMPNIVLAKLKGQALGRDIALYWRDASPWHEELRAFAETLRSHDALLQFFKQILVAPQATLQAHHRYNHACYRHVAAVLVQLRDQRAQAQAHAGDAAVHAYDRW